MKQRTKDTLALLVAIIALLMLGFMAASSARATTTQFITVDGVQYESTKVSGNAVHFETPNVSPTTAFTDRNVWDGNGSENLPCQGGIHWIDNKNELVISHCLEGTTSTSTTTSIPTTTSTLSPTTTTPTTSTTLVEETSTTTTETPTTIPGPTTPSTVPNLPDYECQPGQTAEDNPWCCEGFDGPGTPIECGGEGTPPTPCAEDDPCWDCTTMGNQVCGPTLPYTGIGASTLIVLASTLIAGGITTIIRSRKLDNA